MILIVNREMMFSNREQYIGSTGDDSSEIRLFRISRIMSVDIAHLTFKLDLQYYTGDKDACYLKKEITEDYIYLQWEIEDTVLQVPGPIFANIRAFDDLGEVRWSSYRGVFYSEEAIDTPGEYEGKLTELEQIERELQSYVERAAESETSAGEAATLAANASESAAESKESAASSAEEAKTAREEAEDAARRAVEVVVGKLPIATVQNVGASKPDGTDLTIEDDGTLKVSFDGKVASKEYVAKEIGIITETGIPKLMVYPLAAVASEEDQTSFEIELETFDADTDTVLVQSGRTMLFPEQDFTISEGNIILNEGVPSGRTIGIYIFKNVPMGEDGSVSGLVISAGTLPLDRLAEMPSATDVGAIKVYTDFSELGLEVETATHETIVNAMENNSMFLDEIGEKGITSGLVPEIGTLRVTRLSIGKCVFELFPKDTTKVYIGTYASDNGWTGWDSFLPLTGGILSGDLTTTGTLFAANKKTALYASTKAAALRVKDSPDSDLKGRELAVYDTNTDVANSLKLWSFDHTSGGSGSNGYVIYGTHNKPSGSYTGNGSATSRTIETGGLGKFLMVYAGATFIIVWAYGAIQFHSSNKAMNYFGQSELKFVDGTLTIATSNSYANGNGATYTYQVL